MRRYSVSNLLLMCHCFIIGQCSGLTTTLSGSGTYAVLGQTFQFTCTVTNDDDLSLGTVAFTRVGDNPVNTFTPTCSGGSSDPGYSYSCGSSGVYYMNIASVRLQDDGRWKCKRRSVSNNTITLPVYYKPTISGIESSYPVRESSPLQINCSRYTTPGNPSTTSFRWTGPGSYTYNGPVLSISSIGRTQTGQYTCTATNTLTPTGGPLQSGTATGQFQVDVQYPAVITSYTINSNTNTVTVNESDSVTMRCQVDSNPRSTITLYNGSRELSKGDNTLTHEHRWTADCRQRGNYSCTVGNNIGSSSTVRRLIQLVVTCSPRQDETYPVEPKYASSIGSDISLSVTLLSYPKPIIFWRKTNGSSHRNLTSISIERLKSDISVTASLTLNGLQEEDFGEYLVQADNGMEPSVKYTLTLEPKGPPIPSVSLTILSKSSNSLWITWKQGFNGGDDQSFTVEYSTDDLLWKTAGTRKETGSGQYLHMDINGLEPQTVYYVRVAASNQYGTTYTDSVVTLTEREIPGGLIAGVTVGVVFTIAVVVVLLIRRGFRCVRLKPGSTVVNDGSGAQSAQADVTAASQDGERHTINPYADLSDRQSDKQTYTELRTYENNRATTVGADESLQTSSEHKNYEDI